MNPALPTAPEPVLLATYTAMIPGPALDILISLGPSTPSSVGGMPAYVNQNTAPVFPFTFASSLVINPVQLSAPPLHGPDDEQPPIPEPASLSLLGLGGLALFRRRRTA